MRCKICNEKFDASKHFNRKTCFKKECIDEFRIQTLQKEALKNLKKIKDQNKLEQKERFTSMKINSKGNVFKKQLQDEINSLARKTDLYFKFNLCIDCSKPYGKQQDGGHFNSVGSNPSIRYNLHNIHSQKSDCNRNGLGGGKRLEYYEGLQGRYSKEYADFVRYEIALEYKTIKLTNKEIHDKIPIVRKLNRDFETFKFNDPIEARNMMNTIIGIYTKGFKSKDQKLIEKIFNYICFVLNKILIFATETNSKY